MKRAINHLKHAILEVTHFRNEIASGVAEHNSLDQFKKMFIESQMADAIADIDAAKAKLEILNRELF